jgi:hypothetical protein
VRLQSSWHTGQLLKLNQGRKLNMDFHVPDPKHSSHLKSEIAKVQTVTKVQFASEQQTL